MTIQYTGLILLYAIKAVCCNKAQCVEWPNAECLYFECCQAECQYAECHYATYHNVECHQAECQYGECHLLNSVMLNSVMPNAVILSIVMLNASMLNAVILNEFQYAECHYAECCYINALMLNVIKLKAKWVSPTDQISFVPMMFCYVQCFKDICFNDEFYISINLFHQSGFYFRTLCCQIIAILCAMDSILAQ